MENLWLERRFDDLYREHEDPWKCFQNKNSFNNEIFLKLIFTQEKIYHRILDIGCGLGALTEQLYFSSIAEVIGIDISKIAVEKARARIEGIEFHVRDIIAEDIGDLGKFDLIVVSETLWYICDKINDVLKKIKEQLGDDGILAIHQYFPNGQKYYKEFINGLSGFETLMQEWVCIQKVLSYKDETVLLALYKRRSTNGK